MEFSAIICSYQGYQVPKIALSSRVCFSKNSLNQTNVPYKKHNEKNKKRSVGISGISPNKNPRPQSIASMVFMMNASGDIASGEALGFNFFIGLFIRFADGSQVGYTMLYRPPKFANHFIIFCGTLWDISQCAYFFPSFWRLTSTIAWWWLVVEEIFQWWYPNFVWGGEISSSESSWLFV